MNTLEVGSASDVALAIAGYLPENTSQTARELYRVLVEVGIRVEEARGHVPSVVESCYHLPVELVGAAASMSRMTVWRHLRALVELGVVSYRAHKGTWRGGERVEVRNTGCVWRVRLTPLRGSKVRVSAEDLRHKWRGREVRGAASKRVLIRTQTLRERSLKVQVLADWALNPGKSEPVKHVCNSSAQIGLEALLDLTGARRQERAQAVDTAAQALAQAMRDASSLNFYRKLLWALIRRFDSSGRDDTRVIYLTAQRCAVDTLEGFARRPGALFVSRLRGNGWLAELMAAPPTRVS